MSSTILQAARRIQELRKEFPQRVGKEIERRHENGVFEFERITPLYSGNSFYLRLRGHPQVRKVSYDEKNGEYSLKAHKNTVPGRVPVELNRRKLVRLAQVGFTIDFEPVHNGRRYAGNIEIRGNPVGTIVTGIRRDKTRGPINNISVKAEHFEPVVKALFD